MSLKIISSFILCSIVQFVGCSEPTITLKQGIIVGLREQKQGKDANVFLGIPYAKPPLNELRFRKPQPLTEKWEKPLEAKKWPNSCIQEELFFPNLTPGNEDCLYLNIWSPVDLDSDFTNNLKSVMVWIHGGGFVTGSSSFVFYNATSLSILGDVVVVTLNYRLGALGFLYGGNDDMPGNMGLYDQALALEWVQENIAYFGGDKDSVTIFGESAGSMSVVYHLLSPVSQSLFKNAIAMSGVARENVLTDSAEMAVKTRNRMASLLGCEVDDHDEIVSEATLKCLREVDAHKFISPELNKLSEVKFNAINAWFYPTFGESFLPKNPQVMWKEKLFKENTSLLIGTVLKEGEVVIYSKDSPLHKKVITKQDLRDHLDLFSSKNGISMDTDEIEKLYFGADDEKQKDTFFTALGDFYFNCPISKFSEHFSEHNHVYQYLLDFKPVFDLLPQACKGMCHGIDVAFTFGTTFSPK